MHLPTWPQAVAASALLLVLAQGATPANAVPSSGPPAAPVTHTIKGNIFIGDDVRCGSPSMCFAVSQQHMLSRWGITRLASHGASARTALLGKGSVAISLSCPTKSGCALFGTNSKGVEVIYPINKAGKLGKPRPVHAPAGLALDHMACKPKPSDCMLAGASGNTVNIVTVKGSKTTVHHATFPKSRVQSLGVDAVACSSASSCVVVGLLNNVKNEGFILSTHNGKPTKVTPVTNSSGGEMVHVSCPSKAHCYALGNGLANQSVDTLTHGKVTHTSPAPVGTDLKDLACATAESCFAVGTFFSDGASQGMGTIIPIQGGVLGTPQHSTVTVGYVAVGALKNELYAIGAAKNLSDSLVSAS